MYNSYSNKYVMLKKKILEECVEKIITQKKAGELLNVSRQTISKWLCRYKRFGEDSLIPQQRKKRDYKPHNKPSQETEDIILKYMQIPIRMTE